MARSKQSLIFADYNATTPVASSVIEAISSAYNYTGNMSSSHQMGQRVRMLYDQAIDDIATHFNCIGWSHMSCSSATEANNWYFYSLLNTIDGCPRVITSSIEHPCVLKPLMKYHELGNIELKICPVTPDGFIDMNAFQSLLTENTILVSVMLANNEVGTIQPIKQISEYSKAVGALVHSDIVQAVGKIPVDLQQLGIDAASVSSHKCYAPTGYGALLVNDINPLQPMIIGGAQQEMLRAGTVHVTGAIGLAAGLAYCQNQMPASLEIMDRLTALCEKKEITVFGAPKSDHYLWNTINISLSNHTGHNLMMQLDDQGVAVSTGSACSTGAALPSEVIQAMGYDEDSAAAAVRLSFGYPTTNNELDIVFDILNAI
jgi:cysteine desulfurase